MKKEKVKTNNKKIEKEKKLVQDIISKYSETFKALGDYDKKEPSIISKARCTDDKQFFDFIAESDPRHKDKMVALVVELLRVNKK